MIKNVSKFHHLILNAYTRNITLFLKIFLAKMVVDIKTLNILKVLPTNTPMELLLEADPSEKKVKAYLDKSYCYIAKLAEKVVGVYVLQSINKTTLELMNIATHPDFQGKGIGAKMLESIIQSARDLGVKRLELGTGTFGYQLAFYQKAGFRVDSIDKDFFLKNYEEPIFEMGIQHKDMLRLVLEL